MKTIGPAWWFSLGAAYGWAGESSINGVEEGDDKLDLYFGPAFGFRVGESQSLRCAYVRNETLTDVGADTDSAALGCSVRF